MLPKGEVIGKNISRTCASWKQIEAMIAEGDLVAVRATFTGTHSGAFNFESRKLSPTGKSLRAAEMFFFRIAGGKVVESWATWDRLTVLTQLDAAPTR